MQTYNRYAFEDYRPDRKALGERVSLPKEGATSDLNLLKQGVWVYFILLIFEGALRKWLLPGLATPLLVVRDPLALWLLLSVWRRGLLPTNPYVVAVSLIGMIGIFTATLLGHGNIAVALFGARILLIYFPLMFAIGRIFSYKDALLIGKVTLWLAIPMTILIAMQFYSPQSAWVNRGIGGDISGAGFSGSEGYMRPPGTFSFTNGVTLFYGFLAPFVLYFWFQNEKISRMLLIAATVALIAAIPLSISRSLLFQIVVTMVFATAMVMSKPKYLTRLLYAGIGVFVALAALSHIDFFTIATGAFSSRFEVANKVEGGLEGVLIDRYMGGMIGAITTSDGIPFWGYGLGMGTNIGSMLLTGGHLFMISEGEWGRLIGESGIMMGLIIIIVRLGFCVKLTLAAYHDMVKGNLLPWMLLSFGLLIIPQGQWAQPTALGFSTLIGGMIIASMRSHETKVV